MRRRPAMTVPRASTAMVLVTVSSVQWASIQLLSKLPALRLATNVLRGNTRPPVALNVARLVLMAPSRRAVVGVSFVHLGSTREPAILNARLVPLERLLKERLARPFVSIAP